MDKNLSYEKKLLDLGLSRTVYSFYCPETQKIVDQLWAEKPHHMYHKPYLQLQSGLHGEFKNQWLQWSKSMVDLNTNSFKYFYPCQGSSEAIRDLIAHIGVQKGRIHVFQGDYEGYAAYAKAFKVEIVDHDRDNYFESLKSKVKLENKLDYFILSQPSSLNGNVWSEFSDFIETIEKNFSNLNVAVDLCYVGTTGPVKKIDMNSEVIKVVFISLSKVFGVYYHRIGGVFHRTEVNSLVGNDYFRNLFSLYLGIELLKNSHVNSLYENYKNNQNKLVKTLNSSFTDLKPSDCVLLAHTRVGEQSEKLNSLELYVKRNQFIRVCLTPGLEGMFPS